MTANPVCEHSGYPVYSCCEQLRLVAQLKELTSVSNPTTDGIIFIFLPAVMLYHRTADI